MPRESDGLRETVRRLVREALETSAPGATVAIGSDHSGFALKDHLVGYVRRDLGLSVEDCGTTGPEPVDYPDIARIVATAVRDGRAARGILIDGAGIGSSMAANKIRGVRAALCHDLFTVRNSREHNDANVLVLGSNAVSRGAARRLVQVWLSTPFAGGRHARRVEKVMALERG